MKAWTLAAVALAALPLAVAAAGEKGKLLSGGQTELAPSAVSAAKPLLRPLDIPDAEKSKLLTGLGLKGVLSGPLIELNDRHMEDPPTRCALVLAGSLAYAPGAGITLYPSSEGRSVVQVLVPGLQAGETALVVLYGQGDPSVSLQAFSSTLSEESRITVPPSARFQVPVLLQRSDETAPRALFGLSALSAPPGPGPRAGLRVQRVTVQMVQ
jgi:hypothetical protein